MAEMDLGRIVDEMAGPVGATMQQDIRHRVKDPLAARACKAGDTAHGRYFPRLVVLRMK
jgi:hypothetical protein